MFRTYLLYELPNPSRMLASCASPGWYPVEYAGRCPSVTMYLIDGSFCAWFISTLALDCQSAHAPVHGSGYVMNRTGPASNQPQSFPQHEIAGDPGDSCAFGINS